MRSPDLPAVTLDAAYVETHGAESGCPERELWKAVLRQAADDLLSLDEAIRADATSFFESPDLPLILALAGIDQADAPWLRRRALELASTAQHTPTGPGKRITYRGQTRTLTQWAEVTGVSLHALSYRLRNGWAIGRALTTPNQKRPATTA